jgi:ATP-dependent Clp protease ATP-binding subunit ClpC
MSKIERVRREQLTVAGWNADLFEDEKTRFTTHARIALLNALGLAQFLHHNYVGTEHLIWGLTNHQEGGAAQLLHTVGVTSITLDQSVFEKSKSGGNAT